MFYAGIGSRQTPAGILTTMTRFASAAEDLGYILRSGGADGADSAFEAGVKLPFHKQIFLPWPGFNGNPSLLTGASEEAFTMAAKFHPAWNRLSQAARKFHARNCHQVLGADLDSPVNFVVCWTPGGKVTGGTGQALRIAEHYGIHIFNLGRDGDLDLLRAWYKEAACGSTK